MPGNELEDVRDWRIDEVVRLIRGPTKVKLEVIPNSAPDDVLGRVIEITRGLVKLEDQAAKKKNIEIYKLNKSYNIGVIDLPAFYMDFDAFSRNQFNYKSSSKDVRNLLRELEDEQVDGVILDLRGNSGGSLYEAYSLAKLFIGKGSIVQVMESNGLSAISHTRGVKIMNTVMICRQTKCVRFRNSCWCFSRLQTWINCRIEHFWQRYCATLRKS